MNKVSSKHKRLAFVDGFAGAGRYGGGEEGSPVIAVKWNDSDLMKNHAATLMVHACESDEGSAAALSANLASYIGMTPPRAAVYASSFQDAMPGILEATAALPTIFFIDPCGAKDITFPKLQPLLDQKRSRSAPLEVFVRIDPVLLARWAGWLRVDPTDPQKAANVKKFKKLLEEMHINTEDPSRHVDTPDMSDLLDEYVQSFRDRFDYVQIVPIRDDYYAAPKYYLVHGTDSPDGAAKINDVVSTTEDALFDKTETERAAGQGSLWQPTRHLRVTIPMARGFVIALLRERGPMDFVHICAELAVEFGPDLREKHHRRALKELVTEGKVKRFGDGAYKRATLFSIPEKA